MTLMQRVTIAVAASCAAVGLAAAIFLLRRVVRISWYDVVMGGCVVAGLLVVPLAAAGHQWARGLRRPRRFRTELLLAPLLALPFVLLGVVYGYKWLGFLLTLVVIEGLLVYTYVWRERPRNQ